MDRGVVAEGLEGQQREDVVRHLQLLQAQHVGPVRASQRTSRSSRARIELTFQVASFMSGLRTETLPPRAPIAPVDRRGDEGPGRVDGRRPRIKRSIPVESPEA